MFSVKDKSGKKLITAVKPSGIVLVSMTAALIKPSSFNASAACLAAKTIFGL
jgi:hypothetical protein